MSALKAPSPARPLGPLRRFAARKRPAEYCDLCSAMLGSVHPHLIELANRRMVCACDGCALLFCGQQGAKYKRVPRRVRYLPDFRLTEARWDALMIPINMAFFFESSPPSKVLAYYPSPAGATESLLPLDTWTGLVEDNPVLREMEADVEALLVNRLGRVRGFSAAEHYIVPIDECFRLVGVIRIHWRGLSGGPDVWREIGQFFSSLKERSVKPNGGFRA